MSGIQTMASIPSAEEVISNMRLTKMQKEMIHSIWPENNRFLDKIQLEDLKQKGIVYDTPINPTTKIIDTICTIKNEPCFESKQENNYSTLVE